MKTLGVGFYFEDFKVGNEYRTLGRTVTETDIINFVNCCGMSEQLFINEEYILHQSRHGKRLAPGALVYAMAEGLVLTAMFQNTGIAFLEMTYCITQPVFAGDTIHVQIEVTETLACEKPDRALVRTDNRVVNQLDEAVAVYTPLRLVKTRGTA